MLIKLDVREEALSIEMSLAMASDPQRWKNVSIQKEQLPLGDAILVDSEGKEVLVVERKSLADLAASITDGRYAEQGLRLNSLPVHNHNIVYMVEGDLLRYVPKRVKAMKRAPLDRYALISSLATIQYSKGFSVARTMSIQESALWLLQTASKIEKSKLSSCYDSQEEPSDGDNSPGYVSVVKRVKKDNVTPDNICAIMLCQIPGVSTALAQAVAERYRDMGSLSSALREDGNVLNDIMLVSKTSGKSRRAPSTALANIVNYVLGKGDIEVST